MKSLKTVLLIALLPVCNLALSAAIPASERQALIDLYNSTNGDAWTGNSGWKKAPLHTDGFALPGTENTWHGVTTDGGNTTVMQIDFFAGNRLTGSIPAGLGNLKNLWRLSLSSNRLTGSIPKELGNLINLGSLYLSGNRLSGDIPAELGNLINLTGLNLSSNLLSGSIPAELGNLSKMGRLELSSNQLSGSIPAGLSRLTNLFWLDISSNQLTGSIPAGLGNLTNLSWLNLSSNRLTGSIPGEIGNLTNMGQLYLHTNQLSGSIPAGLGNLVRLGGLYLFSNQLMGSIPAELGNLANLRDLWLYSNRLTGSIPPELGNLFNLQQLTLNSNRLTGSIPAGLGNLIHLVKLYLASNQLSGSVPSTLTNLTALNYQGTDFTDIGYNALFTSDSALITFLNAKDPDWALTQTISPNGVAAVPAGSTSVYVSWTPITYTEDMGGYRVFVGTASGGPYALYAQTANKSASSQLITGLTQGRPYYFVVQTRTDIHSYNLNVVDSENSAEVLATPIPIPRISLSKTALAFGTIPGGALPSSQSVMISNSGEGTLAWTAVSNQSWLSVSPGTGTGTGMVNVGVNALGLTVGTYTGMVSLTAAGAFNSPQFVSVTLKVIENGVAGVPFGSFDTPTDGSTVGGSLAVTGWALDDTEVSGVKIYRNPIGGEFPQPNGLVFIGEAAFVEGARPDVELLYPDYPLNSRAGWGYMLLTNFLPNGGNGIFVLSVIVADKEGHQITLGQKTITCDNAQATKPFGAIDTPAQGGTALGSAFINFGWALTPMPKSIPIDGSTITVYVDGLPLGHPLYNNYRSDIATLFPGYANSDGAVGVYSLDTTGYSDGMHTIAWIVSDTDGAADGIGSRFFNVFNTGGGVFSTAVGSSPLFGSLIEDGVLFGTADYGEDKKLSRTAGLSGRPTISQPLGQILSVKEIGNLYLDFTNPIHVRRGYDFDRSAEPINQSREGSLRVLIPELERIAIYLDPIHTGETREELEARRKKLPGKDGFFGNDPEMRINSRYSAYLVVGAELRPLPIGSTFDAERGVLYWQPGPGFLGDYDFVFVDGDRNMKKVVKIRIGPK